MKIHNNNYRTHVQFKSVCNRCNFNKSKITVPSYFVLGRVLSVPYVQCSICFES